MGATIGGWTNSNSGEGSNRQDTLLEQNCGQVNDLNPQNVNLGFPSYVSAQMNQPMVPIYLTDSVGMSSTGGNNYSLNCVSEPSSMERQAHAEATSYARGMPVSNTGLLWNAQDPYAWAPAANCYVTMETPRASFPPIPEYPLGAPYGGNFPVTEAIPLEQCSWAEILSASYQMPTACSPILNCTNLGDFGGCFVPREEISAPMLLQTPQYSYSFDPNFNSAVREEIPAGLPTDTNNATTNWGNMLNYGAGMRVNEGLEAITDHDNAFIVSGYANNPFRSSEASPGENNLPWQQFDESYPHKPS